MCMCMCTICLMVLSRMEKDSKGWKHVIARWITSSSRAIACTIHSNAQFPSSAIGHLRYMSVTCSKTPGDVLV